MPYSFGKRLQQAGGKKKLYIHIVVRTVVLFLLGRPDGCAFSLGARILGYTGRCAPHMGLLQCALSYRHQLLLCCHYHVEL
jgi:hypothetical protein